MALTFTKKKPAVLDDGDEVQGAQVPETPKAAKVKPVLVSEAASAGKLSFMKTGKAAKEAMASDEARRDLAKAEAGKLWQFWMPAEEERQVTFLDGVLDEEGMLAIPMYYQHMVRLNGNWQTFVCTASIDETQPCPVCEKGDRPTLVGVMTVIDHSSHTVKSGPNQGKVIKNSRKLFVAKPNTLKVLNKIAVKRGGLKGCTFDVSRTGDKEAGVGNQFDFTHKYATLSEIMAKYDLKAEDVQPGNYDEEIVYRSPQELMELGVGKATLGTHGGANGGGSNKHANSSLQDEL